MQFRKEEGIREKHSMRRSLGYLTLPEPLFLMLLLVNYYGDHFFHVWNDIIGYRGFVEGTQVTPILPYTLFMSGVVFASILSILTVARVQWWRSALIGVCTALSSVWFFEFVWNLLFIIRAGSYSGWFGFSNNLYSAVFGYLGMVSFCMVGIRYWKFGKVAVLVWAADIAVFAFWYATGYQQPGFSFSLDYPYFVNVISKVVMFIAFMTPVLTWGIKRTGTEGEGYVKSHLDPE